MSTISSKGKNKPPIPTNSNGGGGGRSGIPTLRSLRTLFAPTSSQRPVSPSRPSLNLPRSRASLNLGYGSAQAGNDIPTSSSSLDIVRRSMTLGRKAGSRSVSRDSREETRLHELKVEEKTEIMDIRPESPVDLSTIVEADTSGLSFAESLSKHLPALPSESESQSASFSTSPSPSPSPGWNPNSASASSLHLPRSPSSINAQVHSALQVDPALAALLSPNNLSFSPSIISAPPSPRSPSSNIQTSLHPQHASTPYSSLRVKNASHLGLVRPSYIRDPSSDDSRSSVSISRPGSSASAARPGTSMSASASGRTPLSPTRTRNRSMSFDDQPRSTSKAGSVTARDPSVTTRRHHYTTHTRSLSHFGASQSDAGDPPQARRNLQRPPITEWLGPRTAKAFKAAGLLGSESSHSYFDSIPPASPSSASAPSSPSRPRFRGTPSYTSDSPNSPSSPVLGPHPRSASVAASAISGFSARSNSVRSASARSGSIRSASTAATSLSLSASASAQATREYLVQSQSQAQPQKTSSSQFHTTLASSSSTLNVPTFSSPAPSVAAHTSTSASELQQLKDQRSVETSALLAALSDAQRSTRILRAENDELRDALALSEAKQNDPEREHLEAQLAEMEILLKEERGRRREEMKEAKEMKSRLAEAEPRAVAAESTLAEFKNINLKLCQALHAAQREKACVEADAETRAEEALKRIEQLEDALADASGAIGDTIGMTRILVDADGMNAGPSDPSAFPTDSQVSDHHVRGRPRWATESTPSSSSSSRPPSIFPQPPENMSLLMYESGEGVERSASEFDASSLEDIYVDDMNKSDTGGDAVDSNLDDSENQWRHSMHRRKHLIHSRRSPQANSVRLSGIDPYGSQPEYHSHSYDHGQNSALRDHSYNSYEFQYEDEGVGNTTFYDFEGDSIISSDGDPDSLDPDADPTIHANATASHYRSPNSHSYLHSHSHLHSSLSASSPHTSALNIQTTATTKAAARDEEDDGTSFEGTGTPGSPASLLWMDPAVERHLGDLSVDNLSLNLG